MEEATILKLGQKFHGKSSLDQDGELVNNGKLFIKFTKFSLTGSEKSERSKRDGKYMDPGESQ